jgi:hypothetical protein
MNKYKNIKTVVDGIKFDSKKEASHYLVLKQKRDKNEICDLQLQPKFSISFNGVKICTYIADFRFLDLEKAEYVTQDVKGFITPVFRIKQKLVKAFHNIDVELV